MSVIIKVADGQNKNAFQLVCFTGLRGSEMIGLKWESIDFKNRTILIDNRIRAGDEGDTKNGEDRLINMFDKAKEALLRQQKLTGLGDYIFLNRYGKPFADHKVFTKRLKKLTCNTGSLKSGGLHDLRRLFNTMLKQLGYPINYVLQTMGHKTDDVNTNHYTGKIVADVSKVNSIAI